MGDLSGLRTLDGSKQNNSRMNKSKLIMPVDYAKPVGIDYDDQIIRDLRTNGYVIIPDVLSPETVTELRKESERLLSMQQDDSDDINKPTQKNMNWGRNAFEGKRTQRVYALLRKTRQFDQIVEHPTVLRICDAILFPNYLLTAFQLISIHGGSKPQPLHTDDQFIRIPKRPRDPLGIAFIWAIDEFTEDNGATVFYPGSHLWDDSRLPDPTKDEHKSAVMKPGSVLVMLSTLWHGGGPSKSSASGNRRIAITNQYCQPWIRMQENQTLVLTDEVIPQISPRILSLCGFSIHYPFIGHCNGKHPLKEHQRRVMDHSSTKQSSKL